MTLLRTLTAAGIAAAAIPASAQDTRPSMEPTMTVSPAFEEATRETLLGDVWQDEQLSQRDRGLVTIAALVARNHTAGLDGYVERALDAGVEPGEISETLYHLAYYAGWQNARAAQPVVAEVFASRGIGADAMPPANPSDMLPLDEGAEAQRQSNVQSQYGDVSQGVVDATEQLLFRDLWLRPALAPRDRSMVTVAALIAGGHTEQITFHLNRAMDNGLTKPEASAMLHHLAFYAGWPNIFSAMPVAKDVFESREN